MPDNISNNDYRDLLNEKFTSLHTQIDMQYNTLNRVLVSIDEQVKKTNGRVTSLEDKVKSLEISELTHVTRCPKSKDFEHLEKRIEDLKTDFDEKMVNVNFFVKNPKITLGIVVVSVLIVLFSYFEFRNYLDTQAAKHKTEMIE